MLVVGACLKAAVAGPFFPDWEFSTLFGLDRAEVSAVLEAWPRLPARVPHGYESAADFQLVAINNAMNHLLGYPHGFHGKAFEHEVGASESQVAAALQRWRQAAVDPSGHGYFDRLM